MNKKLTMSLIYDRHYDALQERLIRFQINRGRGGSALRISEIRLAIAWRYRRQLPLEDVTVTPTQYWRRYWPRIESVVKYEELRYTLALCPPRGSKAEQHAALLEETARRQRHIQTNPRLYTYIRLGRTDRDTTLFGEDLAVARTNGEWIAALRAFDRYVTWLGTRYPGALLVDSADNLAIDQPL